MPNPLMRLGTPVQSRSQTDRPSPITPLMEEVEGTNNPYRGLEDHGVDPNSKAHDPDTSTVDVTGRSKPGTVYIVQKEPETPVPVKIVQDSGREYREFWTDRLAVSNSVQLLGRDDHRVSSRVQNVDAAKTVWIASGRDDLALRGWPLGPGKELSINGEMSVYAQSVDGTQVTVALYVETVVSER